MATDPTQISADKDLPTEELRQRLELAEARFNALSESISDFYWETDKDHNLTYASAGIQKALIDTGFLKIGKGLFNAMEGKATIPDGLTELQELLMQEQPFRDYLVRIQHELLGNMAWRASGVPIVDDKGMFAGYRGSAQDISAEVAAEQATRMQALVMKGMNEGVFILSANDVILDVNDTVVNLLGIPREILIGRNVVEDLWPALGIGENIMEEAINAIENTGVWTHEVRVQLSPENTMLVEVRLFIAEEATENNPNRVLIARDITVEREAEDSLRKAQAELLEAQRIAHMGNWEWTIASDALLCSQEMLRIYGLDPTVETMSTQQLVEMVDPDFRGQVQAGLEALVQGESSEWITEFPIARENGDRIWISAHSVLLDNDDGKPVAAHGTVQDITHRKVAELELQLSEDRLRDIVSATSDLLWTTNEDHQITSRSDKFSEITGENDDLNMQSVPWETEEARQNPDGFSDFKDALERKEPFRGVRTRTTFQDGVDFYWENSANPVFLEDGTFRGFRGAATNITAQVQAEQELKQRDVETRAIMSNAPIGLVSADTAGLIKSINPAATQIFGYAAKDVLEKSVFNLLPGSFADNNETSISALLQSSSSSHTGTGPRRITGRRSDGTEFPVDVAVTVANDESNNNLYVISFLDVTEQQETEEKLRQANRMEAVGQLTGGIAHDFNNLMMSMQLNLEFLMEKVQGDEEGEEFANAALSAVTRGSALTSRLLAFSRQQKLSEQAINISELIDNLYPLLRRTMPDSMVIDSQIKSGLWPTNADPHQLENAILNLAINARDAMPGSGTLTIESHNHAAGSFHPQLTNELSSGDFVCIAVTDDGTGMPHEIVEHVFEPFFTTKDIGKGSGLGLSMVYGFVTQSGGKLSISSVEGTGTTIEMFFPRTSEESEKRDEIADADPVTGRVMVVEDNDDVLQTLAKSIQGLGYDVYTAATGPDALNLIATQNLQPTILLTDVQMSDGMTGCDLANSVHAIAPDCQVLIMSGEAIEQLDATQHGPEGSIYLQKPFSMQVLGEKLVEATQNTI